MALACLVAPHVATAAQLVGPFTKADYPREVIDRPLTLPAGMVEGEVGFDFVSTRFEPVLGIGGADEWLADLTLRVGLTDWLQVEAGTAFSLDYTQRHIDNFQGSSPFDIRSSLTSWQRVVPLRFSVLALDTDALDTAVTLTLPFVAHASRRVFYGRLASEKFSNSGRVLPAVALAAPTRWRLTDWLWLRGGQNLFAVTTDDGTAHFSFDAGIGVQAAPMVALTMDTRLASVAFDGDGESSSDTLGNSVPLGWQLTFAPCRLFDVVGDVAVDDIGRGFDDYLLRLGFRARF